MNLNLDKLNNFILPKLLFVVSNFIDDLGCLSLSHLGIHLAVATRNDKRFDPQ